MIDEYKAAGISPQRVFAQSFDKNDILYWIQHDPAFGRQAVYLDDANVPGELPGFAELVGYKQAGINIVGSPTVRAGDSTPEPYRAVGIREEREGRRSRHHRVDARAIGRARGGDPAEFYYQTIHPAIKREGDTDSSSSTCWPDMSASAASSPTGPRP